MILLSSDLNSGNILKLTSALEKDIEDCTALNGALDNFILSIVGEYPIVDAAFGFFEITVGISKISSLDISSGAAFVTCSAVSAWSGLSVHLQIISLCSDAAFPVSRYFAANAAKAIISTLLALVALPVLNRF